MADGNRRCDCTTWDFRKLSRVVENCTYFIMVLDITVARLVHNYIFQCDHIMFLCKIQSVPSELTILNKIIRAIISVCNL